VALRGRVVVRCRRRVVVNLRRGGRRVRVLRCLRRLGLLGLQALQLLSQLCSLFPVGVRLLQQRRLPLRLSAVPRHLVQMLQVLDMGDVLLVRGRLPGRRAALCLAAAAPAAAG